MITITDVAADKIKEILKAEGVPQAGLRVFTGGGGCGCSGPTFEIAIDDKAGDERGDPEEGNGPDRRAAAGTGDAGPKGGGSVRFDPGILSRPERNARRRACAALTPWPTRAPRPRSGRR